MNEKQQKPIPIPLILLMFVAIVLVVALHADPAQTLIGMLIGVILLVVILDGGSKRALSARLGPSIKREIAEGLPFDSGISAHALELLKAGKKIEAIKTVRRDSAQGLKESKDMIDETFLRMEMGQTIRTANLSVAECRSAFGLSSLSDQGQSPDIEAPAHVVELLRHGKKIEAIKALRESSGAGLAEAKRIVEQIAETI